MTPIWNTLMAFACTAMLDWAWARYTRFLVNKRAAPAAAWASVIFFLGGVSVLLYTATPIALAGACVGGFVGTYLAIVFEGGE